MAPLTLLESQLISLGYVRASIAESRRARRRTSWQSTFPTETLAKVSVGKVLAD